MIGIEKNKMCPDNLLFNSTMYMDRDEKGLQPISIALIILRYVVYVNLEKNELFKRFMLTWLS